MGDRITNKTDNCTAKLEYEQLDIIRRDKSTNAYNELHVTHVVDPNPTFTHSIMTSIEDDSKYESINGTTKMDFNTFASEYEQLENNNEDKNTNVYDKLHVVNALDLDPKNE